MDSHNPSPRRDWHPADPTYRRPDIAEAPDILVRPGLRTEIRSRLDALAGPAPALRVDDLVAGYGSRDILHGVDLRVGAGQSVCLIGPTGGGKSTILHSIFGLSDVRAGRIEVQGRNVTRLGPNAKLRDAGIAYVLRDSSVFPDLSVEQNLGLGGRLSGRPIDPGRATEQIFRRYPALARHRSEPARALVAGERRLLELARVFVMRPRVLLIDEPTAGLEPEFVDLVLDLLRDLRDRTDLATVIVEQNAKRGLALADFGCVVIGGVITAVGTGDELIGHPAMERHFPGN
jgi:branched-chain amino acid transport system ATP-binding protein